MNKYLDRDLLHHHIKNTTQSPLYLATQIPIMPGDLAEKRMIREFDRNNLNINDIFISSLIGRAQKNLDDKVISVNNTLKRVRE